MLTSTEVEKKLRELKLEAFLERTFTRKVDLITTSALKDQLKDRILREVKYV